MRPGKRLPPSLASAPIVMALLWAACFSQPDVTKMKCIPANGCPPGYVCVVSGSTGHCDRPTDGPLPATDADGGNTADRDGAVVGDGSRADSNAVGNDAALDAAPADVPMGGAETGDTALSDGGWTAGQGGTTGGTGGSGGVVATGGSAGQGGGGVVGTGGSSSARGGTLGTGGLAGSGGVVGTGGAGTGGAGTGGAVSTGGTPGTGGAVSTGGSGTGGAVSTGGTPSTGGAVSTGGSGTGGSTFPPSWSPGCGRAPSIPSSQYNNGQPIAITASDLQRRYILNVPANYDNGHPYRLVIALHQLDGNDKQMYSWGYYGLLAHSDDSTIFVAPNGQRSGAPCSGTASGESGCGWPNSSNRDLLLIDAIVAQIEESFCVDTNQIFATGWSYGASMAYETACQRPLGASNGYIRAVAVYSGAQMSGSCVPSARVAYYASHGTGDNVIGYDSGLALTQKYATANGCTWATPTRATGSHICTSLAGCATGYPVQFCSFVGDHTPFPDNGSAASSWGPAAAWAFLSQF